MVGLNALGNIGNRAASAAAGPGVAKAEQPGPAPFSGMLHSMVEQTADLDRKASSAVTGLMSGQGVEVHEAMIATQKADMAFELALQVRNKAVGAYQQMMSMQF